MSINIIVAVLRYLGEAAFLGVDGVDGAMVCNGDLAWGD